MKNRERAQAARDALAVYTARGYHRSPEDCGAPSVEEGIAGAGTPEDTDAQTMVADLLCDLAHYCKAVGLDFEEQLGRGDRHFTAEDAHGWEDEVE